MNTMMGTGIVTLPYTFANAGLIFGLVCVVIGYFISYIAASFLIEALGSANALQSPLLKTNNRHSYQRRIELGALLSTYLDRFLQILFNVILLIYLYGVVCIHFVETATCLSTILSVLIYGEIGHVSYFLVLVIFFVVCFIFSLKNIANAMVISYIIAALKIVVVLCYLVIEFLGVFWYNEFDMETITQVDPTLLPKLVGNVVFTFMMHHSLPGIVYPIEKEFQTQSLMFRNMTYIGILHFVHNLLALLAFGNITNTKCETFPCEI
jgi:amino acid permease